MGTHGLPAPVATLTTLTDHSSDRLTQPPRSLVHSAFIQDVRSRSQEVIERRRICALARADLTCIGVQKIRHRRVSARKVVRKEALHNAIGITKRDFSVEQPVVDCCVWH